MSTPIGIPDRGATAGDFAHWRHDALSRRAAELEARDAHYRQLWRRALLKLVLVEWAAVLLMLWSFHTASPTAGTLAFWGALGLGDGGFLFIIVRTWRASEG